MDFKSYLFELGLVGENIPDEALRHARKEYRKKYSKKYMSEYRKKCIRKDISFSEQEFLLLSDSAKRHGQKFATHLKALGLAYLGGRYLLIDDTSLNLLIREFRAIGNNINQMATRVNMTQKEAFDIRKLQEQLLKMEQMVEQAVREPMQVHKSKLDIHI